MGGRFATRFDHGVEKLPCLFPQEGVRRTSSVVVASGDRVGWVDATREYAQRICYWSVEAGDAAVLRAQEAMAYSIRVVVVPCDITLCVDAYWHGALKGACSGPWSVEAGDGADDRAQEAVQNIIRVVV